MGCTWIPEILPVLVCAYQPTKICPCGLSARTRHRSRFSARFCHCLLRVGPRRGRTPRLRWKLAPRLSRCSLWLSCSKVRFVGMCTERLRCVCTLGLARPGVGRFGGGVGWGSRRSLPDGRQQVRRFLLPRNSIRLCCIFLCVLCALLPWWISRCRRAPRRCLCFLELSALFRRLPCRNPSPFENQGCPQALCGRPELLKNPVCSRCCRFRIHSPPNLRSGVFFSFPLSSRRGGGHDFRL